MNSRRFCCVIDDVTIAKMSDSDTVSCPNCGAAVGIVDAEPLARAAGFAGFLRKPLTGGMLATAIEALLPEPVSDEADEQPLPA